MSIENGIANAGAECNDDYLRQMVMVQNVSIEAQGDTIYWQKQTVKEQRGTIDAL